MLPFDEAFLERQQATHPHLDVRVYAAAVREMDSRQPVRNPNGLLVHWLRRAEIAIRPRLLADVRASQLESERYAAFWVQLLRLTSARGLSPRQIAACLGRARSEGFPKLNPTLIAQLQQLGTEWNGAEPPAFSSDSNRQPQGA